MLIHYESDVFGVPMGQWPMDEKAPVEKRSGGSVFGFASNQQPGDEWAFLTLKMGRRFLHPSKGK